MWRGGDRKPEERGRVQMIQSAYPCMEKGLGDEGEICAHVRTEGKDSRGEGDTVGSLGMRKDTGQNETIYLGQKMSWGW